MKFLKQKKGFQVGTLIYGIIAVVIGVAVIPLVNTAINNTKTSGLTNYTNTELTLLSIVSTLLVVGLLLGALVYAGLKIMKKG